MNEIHKPQIDLLAAFLGAIQEELSTYAELQFNRLIGAPWGKWIYTTGEHHVYQFRTDEALKELPDSHLKLHLGDSTYPGILVASRGLTSQVAFEAYLGEEIHRGKFCFEASNLLQALASTLKNLSSPDLSFHHDLANYLFSPLDSSRHAPADRTEDEQAILKKKLAHERRIFVWGPAGTGKTQMLAKIGELLLAQGESLLLVSNTHRAVNNGLARLLHRLFEKKPDKSLADLVPGGCLRYGLLEESNDGLELSKTEATPDRFMRNHHRQMWERRIALVLANKSAKDQWEEWRRNRRLDRPEANEFRQKMMQVENDLTTINRQWRSLLQEGLSQAQVIACTLAQLYVTPALWKRSFDTVIVDEASMALLPALYLASGLAKKRVMVIGDFRQLPPIAAGRTDLARAYLARDIFEVAQIPQWVEKKRGDHPELLVLHNQRRMRPAISSLCNEVFYHGQLIDDEAIVAEEDHHHEAALTLYDTGLAKPWCTRRGKGEGKSRINLYHATVSVQLAEKFLLKLGSKLSKGIGIITPYREQAKLVEYMLDDRGLSERIQVATVHQFQGEERDVIIWDTVDTHGFPVSKLLDGALGTGAARMINVAITRARQHLVILADCSFLLDELPQDASLRFLLEKLKAAENPVMDARTVVPPAKEFAKLFLDDLAQAKQSVVISSPLLFGNFHPECGKILQHLHQQDVNILIDTLAPNLQRQVLQGKFIGPPETLSLPKVVTVCHDFSEWRNFISPNLVLIDDRIAWFAPFSLLGHGEQVAEENPCFRITGHKAISDLNLFFGVNLLREAPALGFTCPLCEGAMVLMWNRRKYGSAGDFYTACSEGCGYNRPLLRSERKENKGSEVRVARGEPSGFSQNALPGFSQSVAKDAEGKKKSPSLDSCPYCSAILKVRYNPERYLFVGCSTWPKCGYKRPYQEECTACEGQLVVRRSQHGIFLGCVHYPRCRQTKKLPENMVMAEQVLVLNG